MRVVLDTNQLVSSLIRPGSVPDGIYRSWESGCFDPITSEWQLSELRRVSEYPKLGKYIRPNEVDVMIGGLRVAALVFDELPEIDFAPDPDDGPLLATALVGHADYLVTGDRAILESGSVGTTHILNPRKFLESVLGQGS